MQIRSSLQRRSHSESSDRLTTTIKPRPWSEPHQQQAAQPQPIRHDFSHVDLFAHDPGPRTIDFGIQPKLTVGAPNDMYEQEADRVAAQVVQRLNAPPPNPPSLERSQSDQSVQREALPDEEELQMKPMADQIQRVDMPEEEELQMKPMVNPIQRVDVPEEDELQMKPMADQIQRVVLPEEEELQMKPMVQRQAGGDAVTASANLESSIQQARSGGQPLADPIRQPMEQAFGADFSGVKVHTDRQADQLNRSIQAKAFTTKQDVFFRQGAYEPGSREGQALLAHELTHVVQQNGGTVQRMKSKVFEKNTQRKGFVLGTHTISNRWNTTRPAIVNLLKEYEMYELDKSLPSQQRQLELLKTVQTVCSTWITERYSHGDAKEVTAPKPLTDQALLSDWQEKARVDNRKDTDGIMDVVLKLLSYCDNQLGSLQKSIDKEKNTLTNSNAQPDSTTAPTTPFIPPGADQKKLSKLQGKNQKNVEFIKKRLESSPDSMFGTILPPILDTFAPSIGDKSKLEVIIAFPVAVEPHSATAFSIGGRVMLDVERKEDEQIKVLFESPLRGVVSLAGGAAKVNVELGVYFEAQAKDSKQVGQLLSYALYQRFRESAAVPKYATNFLWGGSSSGLGKSRSNQWAQAVEKQVFEPQSAKPKDTYIETGGFVGVGADVGVNDVVGVKGAGRGYRGMRYDAGSVGESNKKIAVAKKMLANPSSTLDPEEQEIVNKIKKTYKGVKDPVLEAEALTKALTKIAKGKKTKGMGARRFELAGLATFGPAKVDGKFKLELLDEVGHFGKLTQLGGFHKWELDCGGELTVPGGAALEAIASLLLSSEQLATTLSNQLNEGGKKDPSMTRHIGGGASELLTAGKMVGTVASQIPGGSDIAGALQNLGTTGLRVRVKPSQETGKGLKLEVYIYVAHNIDPLKGMSGLGFDASARFTQWKRLAFLKAEGDGNWNLASLNLESLGTSMDRKQERKDKPKPNKVTKETTKFKAFGYDSEMVEEPNKSTTLKENSLTSKREEKKKTEKQMKQAQKNEKEEREKRKNKGLY